MSEQDLERIATIMTRLTKAADRDLVARLALRDLVATLVQQDRARVIPPRAIVGRARQAQQKPTAG